MNRISVVGFEAATLTKDFVNLMQQHAQVDVITPDNLLQHNIDPHSEFIVAVTKDLQLRKKLCDYLDSKQLPRASYTHPTALIDSSVTVAPGCFVGPFASVFNDAQLGKDCIVGPYTMISHNSSVGQGCIFHPGAMIAGSSELGQYCLVGMRATVLDKLTVCANVYIGAGSLVTKDIDQSGKYVGSPARRIG